MDWDECPDWVGWLENSKDNRRLLTLDVVYFSSSLEDALMPLDKIYLMDSTVEQVFN